MTKKEKRLNLWLKDKNFQPKYLKNIEVSVCHVESISALQNNCYFCDKGLTNKERNELKKHPRKAYGIRLGDFSNKRHRQKRDEFAIKNNWPGHNREFLKNVCMNCIKELEDKLNFIFKKDFAP